MSGILGHAVGVMITIMMVAFITMWVWLWRKKHTTLFQQMANLPMEDKPSVEEPTEASKPSDRGN